jgi:hypothetical protein
MCDNAYVDDELDFSNDLSYYSVGNSVDKHRIFLRSGARRPTAILVEKYDDTIQQWTTIGTYKPKYCPNCGRELLENESSELK